MLSYPLKPLVGRVILQICLFFRRRDFAAVGGPRVVLELMYLFVVDTVLINGIVLNDIFKTFTIEVHAVCSLTQGTNPIYLSACYINVCISYVFLRNRKSIIAAIPKHKFKGARRMFNSKKVTILFVILSLAAMIFYSTNAGTSRHLSAAFGSHPGVKAYNRDECTACIAEEGCIFCAQTSDTGGNATLPICSCNSTKTCRNYSFLLDPLKSDVDCDVGTVSGKVTLIALSVLGGVIVAAGLCYVALFLRKRRWKAEMTA